MTVRTAAFRACARLFSIACLTVTACGDDAKSSDAGKTADASGNAFDAAAKDAATTQLDAASNLDAQVAQVTADAASALDASAENLDAASDQDADVEMPPDLSCGRCDDYAAPTLVGNVASSLITDLSGGAFSRRTANVLYVHNGGGKPEVYAIKPDGSAILAHIKLATPPKASDIEDMAVAPCTIEGSKKSCIYLGDIGDNNSVRASASIIRFVEPKVATAGSAASAELSVADSEQFTFTYEDGAHNAEGLLVTPDEHVYIVIKPLDGIPAAVYAMPFPLDSSTVPTIHKITTLPIPKATDMRASSATVQPCGLGFIVRTYNTIYEFRIAKGAAFETAFGVAPVEITAAVEPKSEAIAYFPNGKGFTTSGEGKNAPIYQTLCK